MADSLSKEKRSWNMSRIRGKDTAIEIKVRKHLFSRGFRFRKNVANLPGKPDIVLPRYKTVIFIHGCYWHRHQGCKYCYTPKSNVAFWNKKFEDNIRNDENKCRLLHEAGWNVITLWECDIEKRFESTMETLEQQLRSSSL